MQHGHRSVGNVPQRSGAPLRRCTTVALIMGLMGVVMLYAATRAAWAADTATPTDTPTATPTDTPIDTPTDTPIDTPTDTPTLVVDTPTPSPTDTVAVPATSTPMPTATPTATPAGATITVNTTADNTTAGDHRCTLREALANVNAAADTTNRDCVAGTGAGDVIVFNLGLPAKIKLSLGQLSVAENVTIVGPTNGELRIDGQGKSRIFEITAGTANISDLTIQKGKELTADGGGILVDVGAKVGLTNCTLTTNAAADGFGGGLSNRGTAILTDCTVESNLAGFAAEAPVSNFGGGIFNSGTAMLTLTNCTLHHNRGGGLDNFGGTATVSNCTLSGNKAFRGGGLGNFGGRVVVSNSTISGNKAASGGGLGNFGGTAVLTNCTVSSNRANKNSGGGIFNSGGVATLTNCTLSGNKVRRGSTGVGIYNVGTATLINTIIANISASANCAGWAIANSGHNLSSDASCFKAGSTNVVKTDPLLAPLANFGGPTDTMALCTGKGSPSRSCIGASPAIDAGDDTVIGPPDNIVSDQRGLPRRSLRTGAHVDIGAYEAQQ